MNAVAIITARGGSKRIPKKNIKEFCGKPIIAYSIEAALQTGIFDEVMVSTDSEEIAEVSRKYGAAVPFMRSEDTSNDFATTADVIEEVLQDYKTLGKSFDWLACIYPTAPFITHDRLSEAMKTAQKSKADSVMTVVRFSFPPQRALVIRQGKLVYQYPENAMKRSQDLEPIYHDCGQFYFCKTEAFLSGHSLITANCVPLILPEEEVQDIDNYSDWEIAESKMTALLKKRAE